MWTLREERAPYTLMSSNGNVYVDKNKDNKSINNKHDKTYRKLLSNKEDAAYIINKALNLKGKVKVKPEELEKYESSYVTPRFQNRQADIVFKIKDKDIFFLIEHQTKVDNAMPFRLEEYKMEIKRSAIDVNKMQRKDYEIPAVVPVVLYTGKDNWDVSLKLEEIRDERFKTIDLTRYGLININEYDKDELLESSNFIDKVFLIEKINNAKELVEILEDIIAETEDEEHIKNLSLIIQTTLREKLGKANVDKLMKKIKGRGITMLASVSMVIDQERALGIKEGIEKTTVKFIKEMKKNNIAIDVIEKITGISKEKIEKMD